MQRATETRRWVSAPGMVGRKIRAYELAQRREQSEVPCPQGGREGTECIWNTEKLLATATLLPRGRGRGGVKRHSENGITLCIAATVTSPVSGRGGGGITEKGNAQNKGPVPQCAQSDYPDRPRLRAGGLRQDEKSLASRIPR